MKKWIKKYSRIIISLLFGCMVFAFLVDRVWTWQSSDFMQYERLRVKFGLIGLSEEVNSYRIKNGFLPRSLGQLGDLNSKGFTQTQSGKVLDAWTHPYVYEVKGKSFRILSYGRDGKLGGIGLDCDLANDDLSPRASGFTLNQYASSLTFQQFIESYSGPRSLLASIFTGGFIAIVSWFTLTPPTPKIKDRYSYWFLRILLLLGASFVVSIVMMIVLTATH